MRTSSVPRSTSVSLLAVVAVLMLCAMLHGWAQAAGNAAPVSAAPTGAANGGLFPDPEPVLVEKASLRGLLDAVVRADGETAGPMIWQLLAVMWKAREQGTGPSEFLAAGYRAEKLKGTDAATVQNCLLSAWAGAQSLALFTPENIALMERGASPRATRGLERGATVNLDTEKLPVMTLTTKALPRKTSATPAATLPEQQALPVKEAEAVPPAFVAKTLEVRLHERVSLDAFGMRNMDFQLDSVDLHGSVAFLFEDRTVHHFGPVDRLESLNRMNREMGLADGVDRLTTFRSEAIPDTKMRGVKLVTLPFGAIYLDEDVGQQLSMHLVIRVASEALMLNQLPPERRKLYEIRNPPP